MSRTHGAAHKLGEILEPIFQGELPVRIKAWDGSEIGPLDAPAVVINSRKALRRLLWAPGELGIAQAYVAGEIDVEGDIVDGFRRVWETARTRNIGPLKVTPKQIAKAVGTAARLGAIGPKPAPPSSEARLKGALHSRKRDRQAISHHYDLSNEFYELVLDPQMAYSCGYWTADPEDKTYSVTDAQRDKLDLICRKLGLEPGMRFLDVGCGWGALILHAAEHYGVNATGITISKEQKAFVEKRIAERGLQERVEVRIQDYREIEDGPYDRVSSIEMGEHVGLENYPTYVKSLYRALKPTGRLLLQQMSRGKTAPGGGAFIEGYVAPDMHMRPMAVTLGMIEDGGFEVRDVEAMREHYVWTVKAWWDTLEANWDEAVRLVGEEQARVWRLYLVGGMLTFEEGRMGVDQFLAVRPSTVGDSGMPRTRSDLLASFVREPRTARRKVAEPSAS